MAGAYIEQAVDTLREASMPDRLYQEVSDRYDGSLLRSAAETGAALNARIRLLRTSVLFAALAAEALINDVSSEVLPARDSKAVDRLSTVDKFVLVPRLCGRDDLVRRGAEPHQALTRLFDTRNDLVHPKPGREQSGYFGLGGDDDRFYGPVVAVESIVAVAQAGTLLHALRPPRTMAGPFLLIYEERSVLMRHLEETTRGISDLPRRDAVPPANLLLAMERRRSRRFARDRPRQ